MWYLFFGTLLLVSQGVEAHEWQTSVLTNKLGENCETCPVCAPVQPGDLVDTAAGLMLRESGRWLEVPPEALVDQVSPEPLPFACVKNRGTARATVRCLILPGGT